MQDITFVGLDVHKATIAVSAAAARRDGEVRPLGGVENRPEVVRRLVERLRRSGHELRLCYEAGPCGTACTGSSPTSAAIVSWWRRP